MFNTSISPDKGCQPGENGILAADHLLEEIRAHRTPDSIAGLTGRD